MPNIDPIWDTKSNQEAEGGSLTRSTSRETDWKAMPAMIEEAQPDPFESGQHEAIEAAAGTEAGEADTEFPLTEGELMSLTRAAYHQGSSFMQKDLVPRWTAAYNAFKNEHNSGSKYLAGRYRGRSKLFRPKTRSTARKKQAEAAAALFATNDAIVIQAGDESDPKQKAGADLMSALMQYRLNRASGKAAIPWFLLASGAHLCALQTSVCISKQHWEYRARTDIVETPMFLPPDPMTGMPGPQIGTMPVPKKTVILDRPRIQLLPPEDVIRDPAAPWENQAQESQYLILKFPMSVEAAKAFLANTNAKSPMTFYAVDDAALMQASGANSDATSSAANARRARDASGSDRFEDNRTDPRLASVWLHENFMRVDGEDYVYWTLGIDKLISDVIPTQEAYPEQGGMRPVVIGYGALEPFTTDPLSPMQSWQPMQHEINDLVNLRLDTVKQTIAPAAIVRRGASVDVRAIQNRSPDSIIYVQKEGDVSFDRPGDVGMSAYQEMERLNADFDDQAGNFSIGSVQTNRALGDTVGGMQMMTSNANALGEFDLRIWVETWVENVLRQVLNLEQYYESDQNILAISAKRAKIMPRPGEAGPDFDALLDQHVMISVDVGLGSSDPMMMLAKMGKAMEVAGGFLGPSIRDAAKRDELINEVFGKAGYKDAAERFFNKDIAEDQRLQQAQMMIQQMQQAMAKMEEDLKAKDEEIKSRKQIAALNSVTQLAKTEMTLQHQAERDFQSAAVQAAQTVSGRQFDAQQGEKAHRRGMESQNAKAQQQRDAQREKMAAQVAGQNPARQAPARRLSPQGAAPVAPQAQPMTMPPGGMPPPGL